MSSSEWREERRAEQALARKQSASNELEDRVEKVMCAVNFMAHATHDDHIKGHWPSVKASWDHFLDCVGELGESVNARGEIAHGVQDLP